jgi:hypothetical protein
VDSDRDEPTDDVDAGVADTAEAAADAAGDDDESTTGSTREDDTSGARSNFDLKALLRQLTTPMVESLDTRLRDQIEAHVDELLDEKVDAAIRDRLSTLDRAVADLSRSLDELERRIAETPEPHAEG